MSKVGLIGNGWVGKHIGDEMEARQLSVIRYDLNPPWSQNGGLIGDCRVVIIAVPTPTRDGEFDYSTVESVLNLVSPGSIAVIKSTILPGTTDALQEKFPDLFLVHCPEFLAEKTAARDAAQPARNIIGLSGKLFSRPEEEKKWIYDELAVTLPPAPCCFMMPAKAAELVKYASNAFLFQKVVFANMLYDITSKMGIDYSHVKQALGADPRIGKSHLSPIDASTQGSAGRGAGGHCFVKDFAAFTDFIYNTFGVESDWVEIMDLIEQKNLDLLRSSKKDLDIVESVYHEDSISVVRNS